MVFACVWIQSPSRILRFPRRPFLESYEGAYGRLLLETKLGGHSTLPLLGSENGAEGCGGGFFRLFDGLCFFTGLVTNSILLAFLNQGLV